MADTVQIAGGKKENMPALPERGLGWCTDEEELFIGTASGNRRVAGGKDAEAIAAALETVAAMDGRVTALEEGLAAVEETVVSIESALSALSGRVDALEDAVAALQGGA